MLNQLLRKPTYIADRIYTHGSVIYNLKSREVVWLENVSSDIWSIISRNEKISLSQIQSFIIKEYPFADKSIIKQDVIHFCSKLLQESILITSEQEEDLHTTENNQNALIKNMSSEDIESTILNRMIKENQLFTCMIEVTQKCNERCIHCYAIKDDNKMCVSELTTIEIISIIDQLEELGCLYLVFSGGEVFYREDFFTLVEYARKKRFVIDIYTNGLLINANNVELIAKQRPRAIYLSVYSMNPEIHDFITRVKGSHQKTIKAIKLLKEYNVQVVINITVFSINSNEFKEVIDFANSINVDYRLSSDITPKNDGDKKPLQYRITDKKTMFNILEQSLSDYETLNTEVFDYNKPVCSAGSASLSISATGDVFPCVSLRKKLGNIRTNKIKDLWFDNQSRLDITKITWKDRTNCTDCAYIAYCSPCMGISDLEHGDLHLSNFSDCFNAQCKSEFLNLKHIDNQKI